MFHSNLYNDSMKGRTIILVRHLVTPVLGYLTCEGNCLHLTIDLLGVRSLGMGCLAACLLGRGGVSFVGATVTLYRRDIFYFVGFEISSIDFG